MNQNKYNNRGHAAGVTLQMIFLTLILLLPEPALSGYSFKFARMWPVMEQPWYFYHPRGLTSDSNGYIYVADTQNHLIQKFTENGQFVVNWGKKGTGEREFDQPHSLTSDSRDFVYVSDLNNNRIQKFTSDGTFVMQWGSKGTGDGEFDQPHGMASDSSDFIYVADTGNHRIQKFTSDGVFVARWGSKGSGTGLFDYPDGLAVDMNNFIYVADRDNNRIQKFSGNGKFMLQWGIRGTEPGKFNRPRGIAADKDGFVYVSEMFNYRIQKFTSEGKFIASWGKQGCGNGEFQETHGLLAARGYVYIADTGNHRIQKFTPDGTFMARWGMSNSAGEFNAPKEIAVDSSGALYVADMYNNRIQKFTAQGQILSEWESSDTEKKIFFHPYGVTTDSADNVYVTDTGNHRVRKFDKQGKFLTEWGKKGSGADGEFLSPQGIATDRNNNVYVSDTGNHRIQKFTSDGKFVNQWGSEGSGNGQFSSPYGVAVDKDIFVYVSDTGNNRIQKFTSEGKFLSQWGSKGSGNGELDFPNSVCVDADGLIYAADSANNRIQIFTTEGKFVSVFGERGHLPGQMRYPAGIAILPDSNIAVTDSDNHRVQIFRKILSSAESKAIVVAGGGPYHGNDLWETTQMCANFAYRTLAYQGFGKNTIYYLSSDRDIDLDGNGESDDVNGEASNSNLEYAVTQWTNESPKADNLILYITDHGGQGIFRMSETEILKAEALDQWMDSLQTERNISVILVYDACYSGSFLSSLIPPPGKKRILMTSASDKEKALFVTQGTVSFSDYFWTRIFNGDDIQKAFGFARKAMSDPVKYQDAFLDGNGDGSPNTPEDNDSARNVYIGNGTAVTGDAPIIENVSFEESPERNSGLLYADGVSDQDGVARVWAVIRDPNYMPGTGTDPIRELPYSELKPVGETRRYEDTYSSFDKEGTYRVAVYARDGKGNNSSPKEITLAVNNPLKSRAILLAGGPASSPIWPAVEKNMISAYNALTFQGYSDEDIYFMSPVAFSAGTDGLPSLSNLQYALDIYAKQDTGELLLYMIGNGNSEAFGISETETLTASELNRMLDEVQNNIPGIVTVIYDACRSGSFLPILKPPEGKKRILISSSGADEAAYFLAEEGISFSHYFWRRVAGGSDVRKAFLNADAALFALCQKRFPLLDDNGNGIAGEKSDGTFAGTCTIGSGIMTAGDDPLIGSVSPEQTLHGERSALICAENVTSMGSIKTVTAVIMPPDFSYSSETPVTALPFIRLSDAGNGKYQGTYYRFLSPGRYEISVYAEDAGGRISMPMSTAVTQTVHVEVEEKKGDMNGDGYVNLSDAILALQGAAGMNLSGQIHPDYAASKVDVNGDHRAGLEEAVFVLRSGN